jgi:hypothetical protein
VTIKLERLFSFYSADLERHAPRLRGCFACPLCYKVIQHTSPLRDVVAEEHIVPSELGGRLVTLTCRRCNNDQGSKLDAHLIQRVRVETGRYPLSARLQVGDGEFGAKLHLPQSESDLLDIVRVPQQSDPRKLKAAMSNLVAGGKDVHFKINYGYNDKQSLSGLLRAAYLLMFYHFGYQYVLDVSAKGANWQIQNPYEPTGVLEAIQWRVQDLMPTTLPMPAVTVVRQPVAYQCFMVILQLDDASNHHAAVMLPPPGQDGSEFYGRLLSPEGAGLRTTTVVETPKGKFLPFMGVWDEYTRTT